MSTVAGTTPRSPSTIDLALDRIEEDQPMILASILPFNKAIQGY